MQTHLNKQCMGEEERKENKKGKIKPKKARLIALEILYAKKEKNIDRTIKDRAIRDIWKLFKTEEDEKKEEN